MITWNRDYVPTICECAAVLVKLIFLPFCTVDRINIVGKGHESGIKNSNAANDKIVTRNFLEQFLPSLEYWPFYINLFLHVCAVY